VKVNSNNEDVYVVKLGEDIVIDGITKAFY